MVGKRAKILSLEHVEDLLVFAAQTRHPIRNQVLVLLSVKAGLRASEISNLTWPMVIDPTGAISWSLELGAAGVFRCDHRLKRPSDLGDQLEAFRSAVDFELFRPESMRA
jgi:hypothetical protein